jgi:hypothetical protein
MTANHDYSVAPLDRLCDLYRELGMDEWAEAIEASIDNGQPIDYRTLPNVNQMTQRLLNSLFR